MIVHALNHDVDDFVDILTRQSVEGHDFIDAIEELRIVMLLKFFNQLFFLVLFTTWIIFGEAHLAALVHFACTQVGRHNDDGFAEVHFAAVSIRESSLFQNLEQKIEDIRIIDRAKCILISHLSMSEPEAHRYIEKQAMDMRLTRRKVAEQILKIYEN